MAEVASNLLNFSPEGTKRRAVSSRGYRTLTPASNGSSFNASQQILIDLPGNVQNTFFDFGSSYLKLRLTNNDTNAGDAIKLEGGCGIYGMIKKIEITTGGNVISTIDEYGALVDKFMTSDAAAQFKSNSGGVLAGTNGAGKFTGTSIAGAGASQTFCVPLVLTPLFNSAKYIPAFSRDQIRIRITLNSAAAGTIGGATDAELVVDNVEFNCYMVEVSNSAMQMINESVNGQYNIVVDDYRHAAATLAANSTTLNAVVGFSFSSLNRVIVLHRPQATINAAATVSIGNRATSLLQEINVLVNGEQYPQRPIKELGENAAGGAEVLAEALVADRSLGYFGHDSSTGLAAAFCLSNPDGAGDGTTGEYFVSVDMESMRADDADKLYAGVDTLGAVVSVNSKYNTAPAAMRVDCYAQYTMSLMLDMNQSGTYSVAL